MSSKKEHWQNIYKTRDHKKVGWYQESPEISLQLLDKIKADSSKSIVDVGCGVSALPDYLIDKGYTDITLVDLSDEALSSVKVRLGDKANIPDYQSLDITNTKFKRKFDIWHDRAVFHFLTDALDRKNYMSTLAACLTNNGRAIIGTFSLDGPAMCSGLDVVRYDNEKMNGELNSELELEDSVKSVHEKPDGDVQKYIYFIIKLKNSQVL